MIRGLVLFASGCAAVSVSCFVLADLRGPVMPGIAHVMWPVGEGHGSVESGPRVSRDIPWGGGDHLTFSLAARIIVRQGDRPSISVIGPKALTEHIILEGSDLKTDGSDPGWLGKLLAHSHARNVIVTVTAPALTGLSLNGTGSLELQDFNHEKLSLNINGAGDVKGHGRAGKVSVEIDGAGSVDLASMAVTDLSVAIDGAGSVKAGPSGNAVVSIDGAGSVILTRRPASLVKTVDGLGEIVVKDGRTAGTDHPKHDDDHDDDDDDHKDTSL
ncbi:DUF2807 domain-containing protein [Acetobacter sp. AN02]|uniref:GIN domain-containing protein n=1 Tax=Acetobacter sp. AN02 TaxID=2894186 RepID=UPI002434624C|nr:DUF2807 domain-containing protein [Acetobacter sp. AN02]MDG6094633.1 DUF2807 domain-containing protein [Acetobacter sp. AN02]